ncbi:bZIP transcription factor domain-containing protein [Pochonia chlamydosporia 170]|uniref:BZIP transcription factor domain-containing protein n=1 Tax=Pochonia chlamydosporia 170 TaxID=1380566 RepID=A0A179FB07_METCM|nr:bZIP transcription factor domain-containing protein [Pochonia chlamydosporia 170]OAQ62471.1 bZIP transcription factor domain-containing protein [Pochonia chlamydosporia 170]
MTADQLARKRERDRLAQRATRARTQSYIQQLEQEIQELRDGTTLEDHSANVNTLQELYRRNKALTDELERLRGHSEDLGAAAAIRQVSNGDLAGTPVVLMDPSFEHAIHSRSEPSGSYEYLGDCSALFGQQLLLTSNPLHIQPSNSHHSAAKQGEELQAPDLWHDNAAASFGMIESCLTAQPVPAKSYYYDNNCQYMGSLIQNELLVSNGQHGCQLSSEAATAAAAQVECFQYIADPPPGTAADGNYRP